MRYLPLIVIYALFLSSCREVTFPQAQPVGITALREVPQQLQGVYQAIEQATGEFADTLIVESWGYKAKDKKEKDWLTRGVLSDTLVLKFYENYYFLNIKAEGQWVLRLIIREPSGTLQFLSIDLGDENKRKTTLKKLSKKVTVKKIEKKGDTYYQINPTPAQLMILIKEGYFTGGKLIKIK